MEVDSDFSKMNMTSPEQSGSSVPMDSEESSSTEVVTHPVYYASVYIFGFWENGIN